MIYQVDAAAGSFWVSMAAAGSFRVELIGSTLLDRIADVAWLSRHQHEAGEVLRALVARDDPGAQAYLDRATAVTPAAVEVLALRGDIDLARRWRPGGRRPCPVPPITRSLP